MKRKFEKGVTLLELMIVLVVFGILIAIALPTYSGYVIRAGRTDAQAALKFAAQYMERLRTEKGSYTPGGIVPTLPTDLAASPAQGATRYTISLSNVTAATYTLTATPTAAISDAEFCGTLSLDSTGLKAFTGTDPNATMKNCWGN